MLGSTSLTDRVLQTALLAFLASAGVAAARPEYPFSGRWRIDTATLKGNFKPTIIRLVDGAFRKDGDEIVMADGQFHRVSSDGYTDEISISVENDHVVKEIDRIRGKLAYTIDYIVSPDGNILTWHIASYTSPDGKAVLGETVQRRVGPASKGMHLLSGTWRRIGVTANSRSDWILKLDGNRFSSRTDGGSGYDAIIGGPPVRLDGDNSGVQAQITRPRPDLIVETDLSAKGTVDDILSMRLMPDGKTLHATGVYGPERRSTTFTLHKLEE